MIKGKLVFLFFFGILALTHFALAKLIPQPYFNKQLILVYAVLVILSFIGNTLINFGLNKKEDGAFTAMFMIFTTVQMLGAMSFSAYLIYGGYIQAKGLVLQFIILFFLALFFQCYYFIKRLNQNNKQKNI